MFDVNLNEAEKGNISKHVGKIGTKKKKKKCGLGKSKRLKIETQKKVYRYLTL